MAITGLLLLGFVVAHLLGNLLIFLGPDALNAYAKKLQDLGPGLWVLRAGLVAVTVAHIIAAVAVTVENRRARPVPYAARDTAATTMAGRTMLLSGVVLLAFIIYHLLHFTFRVTHPDIAHLTDASGRHDVYSMVIYSFQDVPLVAGYTIAMGVLCLHLWHGVASAFQTLGIGDDRLRPVLEWCGRTLAVLILIGYVSIPVCVQLGCLRPVGGMP